MKNKVLLFSSLFLAFLFSSCNRGGKTGLLVPKDAGLVIQVDISSLSSKLSWQEIKETAWFGEAQKQIKDSFALKLLNDPSNSGIDTEGSLVFFLKKSGNSGYAAIQGKLKDAEKFSLMVKNIDKESITIEKDGNFSFAKNAKSEDAVLYFTDKIFVFTADASEMYKSMSRGQAVNKFGMDSLKYFAKTTLSLKGSDLLDSDKRFADLIADKADMHYWMNTGNLYGGMMGGLFNMMKLSALLEDNISTGKMNFENGKIVAETKQLYNKEISALLKKYSGKEVGDELLSRLPEGDVLAAFGMNFNPELLKEILKLIGVDGIVNGALGQAGLNIDDFIKSSKGDMAFALTNFAMKESPATVTLDDGQEIAYQKEKPDFKFVFGASVNDKTAFQKIVNAADSFFKDKDKAVADSSNGFKTKQQDQWFALGSSQEEIDAFLKGGKKPAYAGIFKGHNFGGFVDLQKIIQLASANSKDSASKKMSQISGSFWKNIVVSGDLKNGEANSRFEINLMDGSSNSLKQLNKYMDQMYSAMPKNDFQEFEAMDTTSNLPTEIHK